MSDLFDTLTKATCPEDVFGKLGQNKAEQLLALDKAFTRIVKLVHPDAPCNRRQRERASEAFVLFQKWHTQATNKVNMANYGQKTVEPAIILASRSNEYVLEKPIKEGDLATIYLAKDKGNKNVILKVVRNPANNDLISNEAAKLRFLRHDAPTKDLSVTSEHLPKLIETFEVNHAGAKKQINVFEHYPNLIPLADVIKAYPQGIDLRDAAWMFNRVLGAMLAFHQADIIHGAILPCHIMLDIEKHNAVLVDWCYSVKAGDAIKAISPAYKAYYPPEVLSKLGAGASTDIFMAAKCLIKLLGGDISGDTDEMVSNIRQLQLPAELTGLLRFCVLYSPRTRPNDAYDLYEDFSKILEKLYGKRKFREFKMP